MAADDSIKPQKRQKGIALITTLLITALLVVAIVEFNRAAVADISTSMNFVDDKKLLYTTISGVRAIKDLLVLDALYSRCDALFEQWARGREYFTAASSLLEEGQISGEIQDEEGKISINALVSMDGKLQQVQLDRWRRLLSQPRFGLAPQQIDPIIFGVKDWIDADDIVEGIYGAESLNYETRGYRCRNGPMESVEEMLLVRGVTPIIFYGEGRREGIGRYFTVYGGGLVNINTAPIPVLLSLSDLMSEDTAREMDAFRRDESNRMDLQDVKWYRRFWPYEDLLPETLLKTSSGHFTVHLRGTLRDSVKEVRAVVQRSSKSAEIVYWKEIT